MQNYDQSYFDAKANKRAKTTWVVLMIIVTVFYGAKMASGEVDIGRFIAFTVIGWVEYFVARIMMLIKGNDYAGYKWILGLGYLTYQQ